MSKSTKNIEMKGTPNIPINPVFSAIRNECSVPTGSYWRSCVNGTVELLEKLCEHSKRGNCADTEIAYIYIYIYMHAYIYIYIYIYIYVYM